MGADEVVGAERMARRILGRSGLVFAPLKTTRGLLMRLDGDWRVFVRPTAVDRNFVIAHELGHLAKRLAELPEDEDEEADADRIAATLLAPAAAIDRALVESSERLAPVARMFDMTQSAVVWRAATVRHQESALVAPTVRVISFGGFAWPAVEEVRRWAETRPPKGMKRTRLTGRYDAGRVALRAA